MILFFGENNYSYGISSEGYYNYITYALWVSYNIKDLQLLFFYYKILLRPFASTRLVILLKGFLFKFNLSHHYSKLLPMNRDIKKCIFYYIFTCHCLLWFLYSCYAKFLPISHLTAGKLLCCVFFCSPIVSLHVSASILISRQCNLSSIWGIQIF